MTHEEKVEALLLQLIAAAQKIISLLEKEKPQKQSAEMVELPANNNGSHLFAVRDIFMLSGSLQYIKVHLIKNNQHVELLLSRHLGYWETVFSKFNFMRVHRSRVIILDSVVDFNSVTHFVELPFHVKFTVKEPYLQKVNSYFHKAKNPPPFVASSNQKAPSSNQSGV